MTRISRIMTTAVGVVEPQETLQRAAQLMSELDVGALPVCNGTRLLGIVTDRDITLRGVAAGLNPTQGCVSDVMTADALACRDDQDSAEVLALMGQARVRRLPVVDAEQRLVGIVALADLALHAEGGVDDAIREISEPGS